MPASSAGRAARTEASRSASGDEGADTARIIPTMSGLARPEILATTEWLAEHVGRPGVRILDARWRPDGTGVEVHRAGHIPGAVSVDWRADLVDMDQAGDTIGVYDDTQGLYASRVWWTFRVYGAEHVRVLDGGFPAWETEGRTVERGAGDPPPDPLTPFVPRGPNRLHLTTSDVRGLLGAPGVTLLDARAPAEYRGFEGNTRRLGHIPG